MGAALSHGAAQRERGLPSSGWGSTGGQGPRGDGDGKRPHSQGVGHGVSRAWGWLSLAAQEGNVPISWGGNRLSLAGCSCPPWHFNATAFHLKAEQVRF